MDNNVSMVLRAVWTKGKLQQPEIIQFANAGIDILELLADQMGKTPDDIAHLAQNGQISDKPVLAAFGIQNGM